MTQPGIRPRSWLEVRWRQLRNPPQPIVRAVAANLAVAAAAGVALLVYDLAISGGAMLPGGDLRTLTIGLAVVVIVVAGSLLTYLWVPLPSGSGARRRRTPWAGMLGFFASLPIAYLTLVVTFELLRPLLG
ncbi:MAG TPA: hypothetical protein VFK38_06850 [Candidatus Limnocylindrales bacterium]|nr:hypothetical protein [Candidatus Limnocylindrales bacterium]